MLNNNYYFPWGIYIGDLVENNDRVPLLIDSQKGGFCVIYDENSEEVANNFIENIALRLFEVLPIEDIEVNIFDFSIKKRFLHLSSLANDNLYDISINLNEVNLKFNNLEKIAINRHHNLLSAKTPTISHYNQNNKFREKFHILLINLEHYPNNLASDKRLKEFFKSSYEAGFYVIAFGNGDILNLQSNVTQHILYKFQNINIQNKQIIFNNEILEYRNKFKIKNFLDKYNYREYKNRLNKVFEKRLWIKVVEKNSKELYKKFLTKYPNTQYKNELIDRYNRIIEKEKKLIEDKKIWQKIKDINMSSSYLEYMRKYPNSNFTNECQERYSKEVRIENDLEFLIKWADENKICEYDFPRKIEKLKNITYVNLSSYHFKNSQKKLTEIPEEIGSLYNLEEINLDNNQLGDLPISISKLKNLTRLYIGNNDFRILPIWMSNLENLIELDISNNQLSKLPEWIGKFSKLNILFINQSQLTKLPKWLANLTNLSELSLQENKLRELDNFIISNLKNLAILDISNNQFVEVPKSIINIKNLNNLNISNNQLKSLPTWIDICTKLAFFNISNNKITEIPKSIGNLKKLENFDLENNQILKLPNSIDNLNLKDDNSYNDSIDRIKEKIIKENNTWERIKEENTKNSYEDYLNQYPNGNYKKKVMEQIDIIDKEDKIWKETKYLDTNKSYKIYMIKYPNGAHINECRSLYNKKITIEIINWILFIISSIIVIPIYGVLIWSIYFIFFLLLKNIIWKAIGVILSLTFSITIIWILIILAIKFFESDIPSKIIDISLLLGYWFIIIFLFLLGISIFLNLIFFAIKKIYFFYKKISEK